MNKLLNRPGILVSVFVIGMIALMIQPAYAQAEVINVCSHNATSKYNILGSNAVNLRAKLDNPANFGASGTYGDFDFEYIDVGDNFTEATIVANACNIWFSGFEADATYSTIELAELQNWVSNTNGQVIAGCDGTDFDPVCDLLNFTVTTDTDTYGFITETGEENPLNCDMSLSEDDQLIMAGGVGGYFSGAGVQPEFILAVHETGGVADASKPIVVYTGSYFFTADINMIQDGETKVTISEGPDVITNNDFLTMNALSALADVSVGNDLCESTSIALQSQNTTSGRLHVWLTLALMTVGSLSFYFHRRKGRASHQ